jgi:hypothetical protein
MAYKVIEAAPPGRARPRCGKVRERQLVERPDKTTKEEAA